MTTRTPSRSNKPLLLHFAGFFETEAIAFLVSIVSRYRIELQDPSMGPENLLEASFSLTLT